MRRLFLISATTLLAFLLLVPPAWAEWVWPLRGEVITPYRNGSDPYASGQHRGIDIAGAPGATVVAAASGEVRFAGTAGSAGLTVSVRTGDGRYDTSYLHLSSTAVREGDLVTEGQRLGTVGTTGTRSAEAPHLHFGVRDAGSRHAYHDPLGFLPPPAATQPPRGAPAPQPSPVPVGPAPVPVPAPAPSPHRVPAGAPRRVPLPAPSPRRLPAGAPRRVPLPAPSPVRVPAGAPRNAPSGAPRHAPSGAPRGAPLASPTPAHVPTGAPRHVPAGTPRPVPAGTSRSGPAGTRSQPLARAPIPSADPTPADDSAGGTPQRTGPADRAPLAASSNASPAATGVPGDAHLLPEHASPAGPDLGLLLACLGLVAAAALLGLTRDGQRATRATRHRIARVLQPILGRR
jgi:Peptidase family M23